ncbi:MAG: MATE family efflux transporter [Thermoanaerobacteraceae bacterium]|nr:MATE family efflux transporter [Thermoanaerobacteraceae bacterium]
MARAYDLTVGNETKVLLKLALPMIAGNVVQQLYNVTDTIIVGRFIGPNALAAVGSSFAVMVLLDSIILGFCMGSGTVFSIFYGAKEIDKLKNSFFVSFCLIGALSVVINFLALFFIDEILIFLRIPPEIWRETKLYLQIIFYGIIFTSGYNYFAAILRSMGNSVLPLIFLAVSTVINIVLDIIFIVPLQMGVGGAAYATIIAQAVSAVALAVYCFKKVPIMHLQRKHFKLDLDIVKLIGNCSFLTSIQQSVMNFGILMIQGLVNSFGVAVMAAFAAVVKIESFAYLPEQELGNAFSIFIAQNFGAKERDRIQKGIRTALKIITIYGVTVSVLIILLAKPLMSIFISAGETEILQIGTQYLYIVASFYCLIGYLFMFYGLYRGIGKPEVSIILTIISLGTRVILAYTLSSVPSIGLRGIWWAIPIGWALADIVGFYKLKTIKNT